MNSSTTHIAKIAMLASPICRFLYYNIISFTIRPKHLWIKSRVDLHKKSFTCSASFPTDLKHMRDCLQSTSRNVHVHEAKNGPQADFSLVNCYANFTAAELLTKIY